MKNINNDNLTTVKLALKLEKQSKKENLDNQHQYLIIVKILKYLL